MSGKYLHDGFSLPCPPGLEIPQEDGYTLTPNTLKVQGPDSSCRGGMVVQGLILGGGIHSVGHGEARPQL